MLVGRSGFPSFSTFQMGGKTIFSPPITSILVHHLRSYPPTYQGIILIQPHLAIPLERFLRVRTNTHIHVLIFSSDTFIHGLSFVINIDAGGGYRPGDGYGYGYGDRVSDMTKLISCFSVTRDLIEQGPRRRRGAPSTPV